MEQELPRTGARTRDGGAGLCGGNLAASAANDNIFSRGGSSFFRTPGNTIRIGPWRLVEFGTQAKLYERKPYF